MKLEEATRILKENGYLTERILNVGKFQSRHEKEQYIDEVLYMLEKSYERIGGLKGIDANELMADNVFWKLVRTNGKIVACMIYKFSLYGRKILCGGTNGTVEGKAGFNNIMREDFIHRNERMCFTEVSGKPKEIYDKLGMPKIPIHIAKKILKDMKKEITRPGNEDPGYSYFRIIGNDELEKTMYGFYPSKYE